MGLKKKEVDVLNRVRIYFQVRTVSDIASANGTHINKEWYEKGQKTSWSKLKWPNIAEPTEGMMKVWRKFLNMLCIEHNMLRNTLGKWIKRDPTREYKMMADNEAVYVNKGGKLKKHMIIQRERRRITFEPA